MPSRRRKNVIFTIGHSTRGAGEFISLLSAHGVRTVADVRTIPRSRRYPQFNAEALAESLPAAGIDYEPFRDLGGLRHPRKDSLNTGWRNPSFRGYADYMGTDEFESALGRLEEIAARAPTAIMCAEAVPFRCHRSLIADALTFRGWEVCHITSGKTAVPHRRTPFMKVRGGKPVYPSENPPKRRKPKTNCREEKCLSS